MRTLAGIVILWLLTDWVVAAEVYKCTDASGQPVFSDKPCGDGAEKIRLRQSPVDTRDAVEFLNVVWESLWQQSGYPQRVRKWDQPIRVKFSGASVDRHREFAMRQLRRIADIAGIHVTEIGDSGSEANLEVTFIDAQVELLKDKFCWVNFGSPNPIIQTAKITLHESSVKWCSLHEAMHVMGVAGHPHARSALSYLSRVYDPTEIDSFILKVLYSDDIKAGMHALPAMEIYAKWFLERFPPGDERAAMEKVVKKFFPEILKQLESFAWGPGAPPVVVLKSARTTIPGVDWGRVEAQFLLGNAYTFGSIVEADYKRGFGWLAKAASFSHPDAQLLLGDAYFHGRGVERDVVEAYKWYALAARQGVPDAKAEVQKLAKILQPAELSQAKARTAAWSAANRKALPIPTEAAID